ncbi:hypothetical protein [Pseudodesulfovibrio tunisiensis]|uniref:hypothetical protein n=1 Tax=Pseudodesulfovibrio tunisiensis TaxID=463192 RepID=UPI001FB298D7|nr:hypothetical protein [Pseudodesulfovibrio tunisiensis]
MEDVRVYGDFHRLAPEAYEQVKGMIPFDQVKYDGDVLRVDHEGVYLDIDDFMEAIAGLLGNGGYGNIEYIDNVEWTVTRYVIRDGKIEFKTIPIDNVLDAHQKENGL